MQTELDYFRLLVDKCSQETYDQHEMWDKTLFPSAFKVTDIIVKRDWATVRTNDPSHPVLCVIRISESAKHKRGDLFYPVTLKKKPVGNIFVEQTRDRAIKEFVWSMYSVKV